MYCATGASGINKQTGLFDMSTFTGTLPDELLQLNFF